MSNEFKVTPWEVEGIVNYEKLIRDFGVRPITGEIIELFKEAFNEIPREVRRRIFFSHRDLDIVLRDFINGRKPYLYTGRGPSGFMHIGHIIPLIFTKYLMEKFDTILILQITSDEKFMYHNLKPEEAWMYTMDNILDILALGFDPDRIYIIDNLRHASYLYQIAVSVARKITYSTIKAVFGFTPDTNIGMIFFPALQAAPCFIGYFIGSERYYNCLIPAAVDQDPYWRVTRDIAVKLRFPKPSQIHGKLLPGLKRGVKMSSSAPETAIYLSDSDEAIKRKVFNAFTGGQPTIEMQRKHGGNPDVCVVFEYFKFLFEEDDKRLEERRERCLKGELLCGECKAELSERIIKMIREHRRRRKLIREVDVDRALIDSKVDLRELIDKFKLLR